MAYHNIYEEIKARGMIEQVSHEAELKEKLGSHSLSLYVGFDPTASSLHIGNLIPILFLARLQRAGHRPIVVVGGATGMIGDPSGRSSERQLLTAGDIADNLKRQQRQFEKFLDFSGPQAARLLNNYEWTAPISYLDWLRDVGKHFTVNYMMAKESVRARLEDREQGISYTEFSYMLLQAYDFLHLFDTHQCLLQGGGNDQWGNITAGIELIRRVRSAQAYGVTFPLLTTASGEKFGKSAGNAVWLDQELTSPYAFYQYWIQAEDADVEKYLKLFTFLPLPQISEACREHALAPDQRAGQRLLAEEMTRLVHGPDGLLKAQKASAVLFGQEITGLSDQDLRAIFADVPSSQLQHERLAEGISIADLLHLAGVCASKGEAKRLVQGGGIYLNNNRVTDLGRMVGLADLASESTLVIRAGKKSYFLVRFA